MRVGNQRPGFVVDKLSIGQKVKTTENDLARKPAVAATATNYVNDVIGLLVPVVLIEGDGFGAILEHCGFVRHVNLSQQQGIVNDLRSQVLERLLRIWSYQIIAPNHETVLGRDRNLEFLAIAHHVECGVPDDGQQTNHP